MKKASLLVLLALVVVAAVAWTQRDRLRSWFGGAEAQAETEVRPSPELAQIAEAKLDDLNTGRTSTISLRAVELESLLRYRYIQLLPAFVDSPQIVLHNGSIEVKARVPVDRLPAVSELGEAASFLPDTTELGLKARLLPLDGGRIALSIERVSAAGIPLPDRLVPNALKQLGRKNERGLARNAVALPLPPGVASAYLSGDSLVLTAQPGQRSHN
jgi:hypothetical protein